MKSVIYILIAVLLLSSVSAHETQMFHINGNAYTIVMGSVGEPVFVDDKSGVEFTVTKEPVTDEHEAHMEAEANESVAHEHESTGGVTGLETTLKVEVSAGSAKRTFELKPAWGVPGSYYASFYPTVSTTYIYRIYGTIDGVNVDLPFTCNPAGHPVTEEDKSEVEVSQGVERVLKKGAFGCPQARTDVFFPEPAKSLNELSSGVDAINAKPAPTQDNTMAYVAIGIGAIGALAGVLALTKKSK